MINLLNKLELDNKKIILISLISLLVIYLDFTFLIKFQFKSINGLQEKTTKLKKDLDSLAKDLVMFEQNKVRQKTPSLSKAKRIISEEEMPSILQYISGAANKNNVKIMQIRPSRELKKEEKVSQAEKVALIVLDLISTYHNLGNFINELENGEVYLAVDELKISTDPNNYLQQDVSLVLKTYVKK